MNSDVIIPPVDLAILKKNMLPGVLSAGGFLGHSENLVDIITRDNQALADIGVSHKELAIRLKGLLQMALNTKTHKCRTPQFYVKVKLFTGFQICPWSENIHQKQCTYGSGVRFGSVDWTIKNLRKKLSLTGSGLLVHLIGDHHFFEGKESPYRIEPLQLCSLLNLCD